MEKAAERQRVLLHHIRPSFTASSLEDIQSTISVSFRFSSCYHWFLVCFYSVNFVAFYLNSDHLPVLFDAWYELIGNWLVQDFIWLCPISFRSRGSDFAICKSVKWCIGWSCNRLCKWDEFLLNMGSWSILFVYMSLFHVLEKLIEVPGKEFCVLLELYHCSYDSVVWAVNIAAYAIKVGIFVKDRHFICGITEKKWTVCEYMEIKFLPPPCLFKPFTFRMTQNLTLEE